MTLFTRSCHDPNGCFTLFCAGSVFDTQLMPYCVNSTSLLSKSVIRRYNGQFQGQGQLRTISCYFDLMSKFSTWPQVKKYIFRCVLKKETRWCLHYSARFLSSKVICEKRYILKSLSFFLWPDLGGYDLKRSTRVPLDSEHPKDLFGLRPTVLSLLSTKWHGGLQPLPNPHVHSRMGK